jgi:hypothetical protein
MGDHDDRWAGGSVAVQVRTVYRSRWTRTLMLTGDVEAVLRYDGMGNGERVFLDDKLWARTPFWAWTLQIVYPFVEFDLPGRRDDLPARLDVAASLWPWKLGIRRFRLTVDGTVLYDEVGSDVWFRDESGQVTDEPYEEDY